MNVEQRMTTRSRQEWCWFAFCLLCIVAVFVVAQCVDGWWFWIPQGAFMLGLVQAARWSGRRAA